MRIDLNEVMIEEIDTDSAENNILYELLIYAEWQQEPEILVRVRSKN